MWDGLAEVTVVLDSALVRTEEKGKLKRLMRVCLGKGLEDEVIAHVEGRPFN